LHAAEWKIDQRAVVPIHMNAFLRSAGVRAFFLQISSRANCRCLVTKKRAGAGTKASATF